MKNKKPFTLTPAEAQVMNILWEMGTPASIHEIMARYDEPRPAYTTIATFLSIMRQKQFVAAEKGQGKQQLFHPLVTREEYARRVMRDVKDSLFDGSAASLLNFFVQEETLSEEEIRTLIALVEKANAKQPQL